MSDKSKQREHDGQAANELRRRAERQAMATADKDEFSLGLAETREMVHELRVHQIELEMQNEELGRAQQALDASRARYFDLYDLAPVGYVTVSELGLIMEANLRACSLMGTRKEALIGQPVTRFIVAEDQDIYYLHRKSLFKTAEPQSCELRMKQPDGTQRWARLEATMAKDGEDGAPVCRVMLSDISEQKHLQAQLALADRLSNVGLLAASIGHEVNNPLTYVLYNLETLAGELPDLAQQLAGGSFRMAPGDVEEAGQATRIRIDLDCMIDRARSALEGAHRIRDLMKGMLAFSRVDENIIEPLSVNDVIETTLTMTGKELGMRARLVKDLGQVPQVSANHGQLCQVFLNLLVNATHAIEEGHVDDNRISVRTWSEGGSVLAEISDTGCGIPIPNQGKIFDPFFTTKPIGSGTGLGLSICMKIVTALRGKLTVESRPGEGSTFTVRLPAMVADSIDSVSPTDVAVVEAAAVRGRILVVDDEAPMRNVLVRMLCDHEVVVASSGVEARTILGADTAFDVILCDLMMPGFTGMDLFAWVKETHPSLGERVMFMTGGAFTPSGQQFLTAVDCPLLEKPFDADQVTSSVAALIRKVRRTMGTGVTSSV